MAEVVLTDVVKIYPGGVTAVDHVSLRIEDREFVVLVGPSGCGKSTTLRMVAGLEDISAGEIRIGDRVVNEVAPKDRDIAMVFQNYALYPHMSVYRNMAFGLEMRRRHGFWNNPFAWLASGAYRASSRTEKQDIDRRVQDAAQMLGIQPLLERRPRALSGGQRQRVAVGRAIVRQPKAFLFDEPLSNLDAKLRIEMRAELKRLHRQVQTTTIYVTHDQEEAMTLGDRVVVMKDGIIQQVGSPFEVYERPVNRFVASFVGTPPMNFLPGRIEARGDQLFFTDGADQLPLTAAQAAVLADHRGGPVVLGVRPELLHVSGGGAREGTLRCHASVVEPLGDRMDIYATTSSNQRLIARVPARDRVAENAPLEFRVDLPYVHYFSAEEPGANLTLPVTAVAAAVA